MQPSEIEKLPFYEYEITIQNLQDFLKEKHDAEKKQYDDQSSSMPNMNSMSKNMGKFSVPKIKMPK